MGVGSLRTRLTKAHSSPLVPAVLGNLSRRYYSTELLHFSLIPRLSLKPGNETDSTSLLTANPIDTAEYGNLQEELENK